VQQLQPDVESEAVSHRLAELGLSLQGLAKLVGDHAPDAVKTQQFENYFGRKIAVDASMCLYQFLVCSLLILFEDDTSASQ
jgi:hypothetical protein